MSRLYVANAKLQTEAFSYRVPDGGPGVLSSPRVQTIAPGGQITVSGDLTSAQIAAIIEQHRKYGIVAVEDLPRNKRYAGLVYSVDKPVNTSRLVELMNLNRGVLDARGRDMREMAAIASNNNMEEILSEPGAPKLAALTMEVEEVRTRASDAEEMAPQRVRVTRDAPTRREETAKPARGGGRRKAS